jgi:hypothetical protein
MVDHLHLPSWPASPLPVVPYVIRDEPDNAYDGLGFSSFPSRRGLDKSRLLHGDFQGRSTDDLNEFFQSWLFFGMVYEVLTVAGEDVDLSEFVRINGDGQQVITTIPLRRYLTNWQTRAARRSDASPLHGSRRSEVSPTESNDVSLFDRLRMVDECLLEASKFTRTLLTHLSSISLPAQRLAPVLPEISLSIIILGSTFKLRKGPNWRPILG